MRARLRVTVATKITEGLGAFGLPACLVSPRGKLLATNVLMNSLIPSMVMDRRERITLRHPPSDQLLLDVLRQVAWEPGGGSIMSVPIPARGDEPASVIHVIPILGDGRDLMPGSLCILAVSRLASSTLPHVSLLRGLFDLTPTEAKVARLAASGVALKDIGALANISSNTVKVHLKSIYAKTGAGHHAALVRLLSGAPMPAEMGL